MAGPRWEVYPQVLEMEALRRRTDPGAAATCHFESPLMSQSATPAQAGPVRQLVRFGVQPRIADTHVDDERHGQRGCVLHRVDYQ
jgi:hypothetical protein